MTADGRLRAKARAAGIAVAWRDARGHPHTVGADSLRAVLAALGEPEDEPGTLPALLIARPGEPIALDEQIGADYRLVCADGYSAEGVATVRLPAPSAIGYHRLEVGGQATTLAVVPPRCLTVADVTRETEPRLWGLAVQLYGLGDGHIGGFGELARFCRAAAGAGADAVAISPVHALFAGMPQWRSPYFPSNRACLNILHGTPELVFGPEQIAAAARLADVPAGMPRDHLLDWPADHRAKLALLRALFDAIPLDTAQAEALARFAAARGAVLVDHARFEALHAALAASHGAGADWRHWPAAYRDPHSNAVAVFAAEHDREIRFHIFAQWLAATGLAAAQAACRQAGMAIGLIRDLAVGTAPGGAQAWSGRGELLNGLTVGAPPDLMNPKGQNWGVTAASARGLRRSGFRSFRETLAANMAGAGGLRIDHILGFDRLWVIPEGAGPLDGAFIANPLEDLLGLLALESVRHRAIVVGEDLGTVPDGLRDRLHAHGVLGTGALWFERKGSQFRPASGWSRDAVAMTTTHDVPTVVGWWQGRDIAVQTAAGILTAEEAAAARRQRGLDRAELAATLDLADPDSDRVATAAAGHIGRTPSPLALLPLEDALGLVEQPNLPGTVDEHPNWRRLYPGGARALEAPGAVARLAALGNARKAPA